MDLSAKLNKSDNLWPDELKILIVDDDQDMLNLVRLSLEPAGFRVLRTTKSDEGLDLALREMPDLLLLDIMMSGIDGLELLRRVRRHPKLTHIPAIIISAWANSPDQLRMLKLAETNEDDIAAYLGKPFELTTLLKTVKTVLIEHRDFLIEKNKPLQKPWEAKQATYH
jgi:CheY-like chemotaxis protein